MSWTFNPRLKRHPQGESPGDRRGTRTDGSACLHRVLASLQTQSPSGTQRQKNTVTADENVSSLYKVRRVLKVPFPITKLFICYSSAVGIFIFGNAKVTTLLGYCTWIPFAILDGRIMARDREVQARSFQKIQPV